MSSWYNKVVFFFFLCFVSFVWSDDGGDVYLGIAGGIESYPWSLRTYQCEETNYKLYPQLEIGIDVTNRLVLTGTFSYHSYKVSLFECFCYQTSEITMVTFDLDYALQRGSGRFSLGAGILAGFNALEHDTGDEHHGGFGAKVYGIAVQPLSKAVYWGLRTSVRRLHITLSQRREAFYLDSFSVELILYFSY